MERRFERDLDDLKKSLIKMGSVVEESIANALQALLEHDSALAAKVIEADVKINALEIEIDNAVVDLMALQQPVASDLRLILSAQKINNDLERIGDHAVNIAESARDFGTPPSKETFLELPRMAELTRGILRDALDSFILLNPKLATSVLEQDDRVDTLNRDMTRKVIEMIKADTKSVEAGLQVIRVSRNLERVADLATNIAEEVIFLTQARVVKHHAADGAVGS
ncbi:MAG: phosphate transport system regulatory protein PhoU [Ignavibacteria bacterium RIFCSPLOWO2_02_FULL_55_14]|nr:MAG: phosphate transport system regulatory protein PhoU [Ignavibacteria bacterium GWC2_56_12]OGU70716.1 MAG: phosphate transport system regulatory protein PhoU [Ignavibacteria bacterium RIFCSPLOWO2_12_FULL_56_21]OGU72294.1 MAG: phosphate transport system regulatory protein PhoU [Ignavibacteria bacterium RIFCSPLOWO2_02_FULL_55_14]HAV23386.1 phosphate transport system regulatory protein PhoU [Bacteroidota bacterium]